MSTRGPSGAAKGLPGQLFPLPAKKLPVVDWSDDDSADASENSGSSKGEMKVPEHDDERAQFHWMLAQPFGDDPAGDVFSGRTEPLELLRAARESVTFEKAKELMKRFSSDMVEASEREDGPKALAALATGKWYCNNQDCENLLRALDLDLARNEAFILAAAWVRRYMDGLASLYETVALKLPAEKKASPEFARALLRIAPRCAENFDSSTLQDRELCKLALSVCEYTGDVVKCLPDELRGDREFLLEALGANQLKSGAHGLHGVAEDLKSDKDFLVEAVGRLGYRTMFVVGNFDAGLKGDKEFALRALAKSTKVYSALTEELKMDEEICAAAGRSKPSARLLRRDKYAPREHCVG